MARVFVRVSQAGEASSRSPAVAVAARVHRGSRSRYRALNVCPALWDPDGAGGPFDQVTQPDFSLEEPPGKDEESWHCWASSSSR